MIQYQLSINGIPFGKPMPEHKVDKMISCSRTAISGELEKVAVKPEFRVVVGR